MNRSTISLHKVDILSEHLDIFFESDHTLETYEASSDKFHQLLLRKKILCSKKMPHRKLYLDYEGEVSNQRGQIQILWKGFYENEHNFFPSEIKISFFEDRIIRIES